MRASLTKLSHNIKTGPIPVSMTEKASCPVTCPLRDNGCYATFGALNIHWNRLDRSNGHSWNEFTMNVSSLPMGTLWRHNQAGDLPGNGRVIDNEKMKKLIIANNGKKGFTYTHYSDNKENHDIIRLSNENGFTVNLSANTLSHADRLYELGIGPVVVIQDAQNGTSADTVTPGGRTIRTCPATYMDEVTCQNCGICANPTREVIIGFPAHGNAKAKVRRIAGTKIK